MAFTNILKQLREQHARLTETILALERLEAGKSRGRGRPPKWLTQAKATEAKLQRALDKPKRGRRRVSAVAEQDLS